MRNPRTQYKHSKNVFVLVFIALIISRDWPQSSVLQPLAQSLIGSLGILPVAHPRMNGLKPVGGRIFDSEVSFTEITEYIYISRFDDANRESTQVLHSSWSKEYLIRGQAAFRILYSLRC